MTAEITRELIYRNLVRLQADLRALDDGLDTLRTEMRAFRGHLAAAQQDTHNIHTILTRQDAHLARIERLLGID